MPPNPEKLIGLALLVADEFYLDQRQDKLIVIGPLSHLRVPALPWQVPRLAVMFSVTNGRGTYHLRITIEHEGTEHANFNLGGPLLLTDPLEVHDQIVAIEGLRFEAPGKYWAVMRCDGEILLQRPFNLVVGPEPGRIIRRPSRPGPAPPAPPASDGPGPSPAGPEPPTGWNPDQPTIAGPGL